MKAVDADYRVGRCENPECVFPGATVPGVSDVESGLFSWSCPECGGRQELELADE